jgi:hypothetical protein
MGTAEPERSSERSVLLRNGGNLLWVDVRITVFFLEDETVGSIGSLLVLVSSATDAARVPGAREAKIEFDSGRPRTDLSFQVPRCRAISLLVGLSES